MERRGTHRHPSDYRARYVADDRDDGWQTCRIVDLSHEGAALELSGPDLPLLSLVRVELPLATSSATRIVLVGRVRNTGPGTGARIRVGIEWRNVTPLEDQLLRVLLNTQPTASS